MGDGGLIGAQRSSQITAIAQAVAPLLVRTAKAGFKRNQLVKGGQGSLDIAAIMLGNGQDIEGLTMLRLGVERALAKGNGLRKLSVLKKSPRLREAIVNLGR